MTHSPEMAEYLKHHYRDLEHAYDYYEHDDYQYSNEEEAPQQKTYGQKGENPQYQS